MPISDGSTTVLELSIKINIMQLFLVNNTTMIRSSSVGYDFRDEKRKAVPYTILNSKTYFLIVVKMSLLSHRCQVCSGSVFKI